MTEPAPRLADISDVGGRSNPAPVSLRRVLVALDASDHANRALQEAARLASSAGGLVTGIHAYAARLHDNRFRQMEGGLPARYRQEGELEHQRAVHDSLITRGLSIISDGYHEAAAPVCAQAGVAYRRLSPEGKNYRRIVEAAASGDFDLLALGALGLGAVPGSVVGTVCARVVRRCPIDALVIRDPDRAIGDGPLVVGLDGSPRAFGALRTALDLGRRLGAPVHAVAAYDPYFHYVAFDKISGVLSEEAGRQFRFKEQEKLHEEIIDSGIARIYQSHLELAGSLAEEESVELVCALLDGKPYRAITGYLEEAGAGLLLIGKTGIHADPALDIGGNAENLLRMAPCHVWLGQATYTPPLEAVARETITWTEEAEKKMARVPETARAMVRMAILRMAQESGHTVVTSGLIDEATRKFCPARRGGVEPEVVWSADAAAVGKRRAARGGMRGCPSAGPHDVSESRAEIDSAASASCAWTAEAEKRLERVPAGFMRSLTRQRIEAFARRHNVQTVTPALMAEKYAEWAAGSAQQRTTLAWTEPARARIGRIPEFIRGMVILEVERCARVMGKDTVTDAVVDRASAAWEGSGAFHSETNPELVTGYGGPGPVAGGEKSDEGRRELGPRQRARRHHGDGG